EGALVAARIPTARRHAAARLGIDADAGLGPETELHADLDEAINVDLRPELVKVGVARLHHGFVQVHVTVYARAAEVTFAVLVAAATVDLGARVDDALLQAGQGRKRLIGRARRVCRRDGLVQRRLQRIVQVTPKRLLHRFLAAAAGDQIGVEARL